jgi:hypothetical protein
MSIKNIIKSLIDKELKFNSEDKQFHINQILNKSKNTNNHLCDKSALSINNELFNLVGDSIFFNKLKDQYRLINDIEELHIGKYIRWFSLNINDDNIEKLKLSNGGFVVNIKLNINNNNIILCKFANRLINIIYEDTIVFQKLSFQEMIILNINDITPLA